MPHKKILMIVLGFCAFAAAALAGYYSPDIIAALRERRTEQSYKTPEVPEQVVKNFASIFQKMHVPEDMTSLPDVPFYGPDGKPVRLSDFKGRPLLVNLWATWCPPCIVELPSLQKLQEYYHGKLQVIAISFGEEKDDKAIRAFLEKRSIGDFAAYNDKDASLSRNVNIRGLPTSFLIGSNGDILYRFEGEADWTSTESLAFFDVFLLQK